MEEPEPESCEAGYRVKKISIRRGWAIDQIKFEYDDQKIWSVGIDGGRKDNRDFILTPGEYLVRVTHETLRQRWYAGASVEFETNKGRTISFHPYWATKKHGDVTTLRAGPGKEILRLKIKHGKLENIVQQTVPTMEVSQPAKHWFAHVTPAGEISEFDDDRTARVFSENKPGIILDVKRNKIIRNASSIELTKECTRKAVEKGYFIQNNKETGGLLDVVNLFRRYFDFGSDLLLFLVTVSGLLISNYLTNYSDLIAGQTLTNIVTVSPETEAGSNLTATAIICRTLYDCQQENGGKVSLILALLITKLSAAVFNSGSIFFQSILFDHKKTKMKKYLFKHVLSQEMGFFDSKTASEIRSAMDPEDIIRLICTEVPYLLTDILNLVFILSHMININLHLTLISVGFLILGRLIRYPIEKEFKMVNKLSDKLRTMHRQAEDDSINMISTVKSFSREDVHLTEQADALDQMLNLSVKKTFFQSLFVFIGQTLDSFSFAVSLLVLIYNFEIIPMDAGQVTAFFLLFSKINPTYICIYAQYIRLIEMVPWVERVSELYEKKSSLIAGPLEPEELKGKIELVDVCFTYPSRPGQQVLRNVNITLQPGKVTAVVGDSGAGKSTLTNLLLRLYDPTSGAIYVDGFNLKELDLKAYHSHIAVVNQNPLLFNSPISDNIAYGATQEVGEQEVRDAARLANADDFIMSLRGDYDNLAGTMGTKLSGGQKQRLAIARAAIRDPSILILDEATSSLDAENEAAVTEALDRVMRGKTILIIAHRLSTVKEADEILVMMGGEVVERGTHSSLLQLDGAYKKLVQKQLTGTGSLEI